jgi:glycerol-3-phosphate O-acyltransferase / dihydroxyacetone phosphate acyltransferase
MYSTGNIPVDRKNKDRKALFRGTTEELSHGSAVALFPEGTSYTEPRIMQVKEGAAWAALEYNKWTSENPDRAPNEPLLIVPCAIVYTNKSKYRSYVRALCCVHLCTICLTILPCDRLSWSQQLISINFGPS